MARDAFVDIEGILSLRNLFGRLSGGFNSRTLMSEIATFLITSIKLRTAKGEDAKGKQFEPYDPKYVMFRQSKGRPTSKVDLFFTGSMLSSMDYKATPTTAKIYFLSTEDKSGSKNPDKAYWLNQKREFFALSDADMREVENMVTDLIDKELRQ